MNSKVKYRVLSLFILMTTSVISVGQSMTGLTFSTYSGVTSSVLNPAMMTGSRVYIDINIIGGNSFFDNDMIFFPAGEKVLRQIWNKDPNFNNGDYKYNRNYTYFNNTHDKYGYADLHALGPSIMVQAGKHAFSISTAFRSMHTGNNIPYQIPVLMYEDLDYEDFYLKDFNDSHFSFVSMTWTELNLSYAINYYERYDDRFTFGVTLKTLFGHEGAYVAVKNLDFRLIDQNTIQFNNADTEVGIALPIDYETNHYNPKPLTKGFGAALNLGFMYTKKKSSYYLSRGRKLCSYPYSDYVYKVGASLLDLGFINFTKNAEKHVFDNVGVYWEHYDTVRTDYVKKFIQDYSTAFYGDPNASYAGSRFRIAMPTVLNVQFDYQFYKNFYLGAMWSQPIKYQLNQLYQPSQVMVMARYENRYLGVSIPVSVFNYRQPRIGLSLRVYSFTIGTEKLGSWLGMADFTGMDFYCSFKINLSKGTCGSYLRGACTNTDW